MIVSLALSLTLLAAAGLWLTVTIYRHKRWVILMVLVPALLISGATTLYTIQAVMGRPTTVRPAEFMFLDYFTDGKKIYVWYIKKGSTEPHTVEMPYAVKMHEKLEQAKKSKQAGKQVGGKEEGEGEGEEAASRGGDRSGSQGEGKHFKFYDFQLPQVLPQKK